MTTAALPDPDYLPKHIAGRHRVAIIGCGGISGAHLAAYRAMGLDVPLLCDRTLAKAEARRNEFFPASRVTTSVEDVLSSPHIDVVDVATHVDGRPHLVARALRAGKHVLSQKPFTTDIDEGIELADLARSVDRLLAVNHNGRWAPHFAAALASVRRGDVGALTSADFAVYWPHDAIFEQNPHFSTMQELIIYDFGIHWFDLVAQLFSDAGRSLSVYASARHREGSLIAVPTDVVIVVEFERAVATIVFRASAPRAESGWFRIEGRDGTIIHSGTSLGGRSVAFDTRNGALDLPLQGDWWTNGMSGAMAELLSAIDETRTPSHAADTSLLGLELCFAALRSAQTGAPVVPGTVRRLPTP